MAQPSLLNFAGSARQFEIWTGKPGRAALQRRVKASTRGALGRGSDLKDLKRNRKSENSEE